MSVTATIEAPAKVVSAGSPMHSRASPYAEEPIPLQDIGVASERKSSDSPEPSRSVSGGASPEPAGSVDGDAPPRHAAPAKERWNTPRINIWRIGVSCLALFNLGVNDASFGAVLPYMGTYYGLSYTVVSLIFVMPFVGYSVAAAFNNRLHNTTGQRGIAFFGPLNRIIAFIVLTQHPPYPVVVVFLILLGFGNGISDAAWNAYVGDFASVNQLLGILHAFYGLGATLAPLIATAMVTQLHTPWWVYYYLPLALCVVELVIGTASFWEVTGPAFRAHIAASHESGEESGRMRASMREKVTWLVASFLFVYVGVEVSLGGWLVTFMQQVRYTDPFRSGMVATGFWAGLTVGRVTLGFITPKIGERLAVTIYLVISIGLELLFWLVPNAIVSAVAVALIGFFMGPLFPAAIVAATKLLPKPLHVPSIGFAAAIGGGGAALLPFAVGALAQSKGVQSLEPVALALLVCDLCIWLLLPRFPKHAHDD